MELTGRNQRRFHLASRIPASPSILLRHCLVSRPFALFHDRSGRENCWNWCLDCGRQSCHGLPVALHHPLPLLLRSICQPLLQTAPCSCPACSYNPSHSSQTSPSVILRRPHLHPTSYQSGLAHSSSVMQLLHCA